MTTEDTPTITESQGANLGGSLSQTPEVCQATNPSVTTCQECGAALPEKKRLYCCNACRQAGYRKSPAHAACLASQKARRLQRRNDWTARRTRDMGLSFDGRMSGSVDKSVPPLGSILMPPATPSSNGYSKEYLKRLSEIAAQEAL